MFCATCIAQFASSAWAQCTARDILQRQLMHGGNAQSVAPPQPLIESAHEVPTWRTIELGNFADPVALRNKLDAMGCGVGGEAAEVLARPAFTVSPSRQAVELVVVSPTQLGFTSETVTLAAAYKRARQLGFELAAAEVGPQLRIQYLDQPLGEFLIIGMEAIRTWEGEPTILNVANGGAGLILIGQDGRADAEVPVSSRFVFAQPPRQVPGSQQTSRIANGVTRTERNARPADQHRGSNSH
ncbi:hypothetical protein QY049_03910 [Bradyrhizobium sp. WYCCWR 13022]|nr:hypothetical protein [Bradyrhizobium sp. WYCCWR 13022]MDN4982368.1 hypothetical protein [Bradyrhizobium sp. WYCCWR 13022]